MEQRNIAAGEAISRRSLEFRASGDICRSAVAPIKDCRTRCQGLHRESFLPYGTFSRRSIDCHPCVL